MADTGTPGERAFRIAAGRRIGDLKPEEWIGRYRVDFLIPSASVVIEIDGPIHDGVRSSGYDRHRDRYLAREGYTVLRFTNQEVTSNVERCVDDVLQLVAIRTPRQPSESALYVDFLALKNEGEWLLEQYGRSGRKIKLSVALQRAAEYMQLTGDVDVHMFSSHGQFVDSGPFKMDIIKFVPFSSGRLIVTEHQVEWLVDRLSKHLRAHVDRYRTIGLMADDLLYEFELASVRKRISVLLKRTRGSRMDWFTDGRYGQLGYALSLAAGIDF